MCSTPCIIIVPVAQLGYRATPNGEQHLRRRETLAQRYPLALLANTVAAARDCQFSLDQLSYTYPREIVPPGSTLTRHLHDLTMSGIKTRWPDGVDDAVHKQIHHELDLIAQMQYEAFFLTVYDVVAFARSQGILCQGRGSAANSAVCYCLGITEVNPAHQKLLFERFISRERNEPPDIDVDFEHERREEVIQYIYRKYGRDRAALAATVISYRPKSALREVGKALGLDADKIDQLSQSLSWWESGGEVLQTRLTEIGLDPDARLTRQYLALVEQILGFPRHLSQHVGGFVIADQSLHSLVPIENAAMPERTIIQWDKDDLESLGLLKVDCLALGMLTAVRKAFRSGRQALRAAAGPWIRFSRTRQMIPATYAMLHKADTVGVFQIESRAQMTMLPRLKPRNFYDLVIEIALVRPGPIQGNMVHPYLARRQDPDAVSYPSPELKTVLERTLGVPIFQEQVMQIAMVAGGFSAG